MLDGVGPGGKGTVEVRDLCGGNLEVRDVWGVNAGAKRRAGVYTWGVALAVTKHSAGGLDGIKLPVKARRCIAQHRASLFLLLLLCLNRFKTVLDFSLTISLRP